MHQLHKEILTNEQVELLPAIKKFKDDFGLVGGTAIALQIGHRESVDFDLFPKSPDGDFDTGKLLSKFKRVAVIDRVKYQDEFELTFFVLGVQITLFNFDYAVPFTEKLDSTIEMPDLLTLAAMKVFALAHRAKWKDYIDLYFIIRDYHTLDDIVEQAKELFGKHFNERLLREQLPFFNDVSYKEEVIYKEGFAVSDEEVKDFLREVSLS